MRCGLCKVVYSTQCSANDEVWNDALHNAFGLFADTTFHQMYNKSSVVFFCADVLDKH